MRAFAFSSPVFALPAFAGPRPWSYQQPDQSSESQLLKQQSRHHRQQSCSKTTDCFVQQIHPPDKCKRRTKVKAIENS
jgi:hypothetical protein